MTKTKSAYLTLLTILLSPMAANADLITTSLGIYDIRTVTGTFPGLVDQLDDQVWWGSDTLAREFADTLGNLLGFPNHEVQGPLFSYEDLGGGASNDCAFHLTRDYVTCGYTTPGQTLTWAIGTAASVSVPEPGPLALLGIGLAALGFARRKREV